MHKLGLAQGINRKKGFEHILTKWGLIGFEHKIKKKTNIVDHSRKNVISHH